MNSTQPLGPPVATFAPGTLPRSIEKPAHRPVEPASNASPDSARRDSVTDDHADVVFPPAPTLLDLINRFEREKEARRELEAQMRSSDPQSSAGQSPQAGVEVDAYV